MKILTVEFKNDELLGDLTLNLSNSGANPSDTIILAGENGCGKTSVLEAIYKFSELQLVSNPHTNKSITVTYQIPSEQLELIASHLDGIASNIRNAVNGIVSVRKDFSINIYNYSQYVVGFKYLAEQEEHSFSSSIPEMFRHNDIKALFAVAFSTVEINYNPQKVTTVTAKEIDIENTTSTRSGGNIATEIKQLFIDIQNNDAIELSQWVHEHPNKVPPDSIVDRRIKRFNNAFSYIFDSLRFKTIQTQGGEKLVIFTKNGIDIPIEALSSGEKQIVFRGAFLLKDIQSTTGRIILIDEPEISLHPNWQIRILNFYKNLFLDENQRQTSQIFIATHSPFVIHNKSRRNDKIIVLHRGSQGITVEDHPEYYECNGKRAIEDAFQDSAFLSRIENENQTVYLEGRTDEKYFRTAIEVLGYKDVPFQFKWVGYIDDSGNEVNTGKDSLAKAVHFLISLNRTVKIVCLFDCDTSRKESEKNNVVSYALNTYENSKGMKRGIENALVLDKIDLPTFYSWKTKYGDYGEEKTYSELDKMALCDAICAMDAETLKEVFSNLKIEIDKLMAKLS